MIYLASTGIIVQILKVEAFDVSSLGRITESSKDTVDVVIAAGHLRIPDAVLGARAEHSLVLVVRGSARIAARVGLAARLLVRGIRGSGHAARLAALLGLAGIVARLRFGLAGITAGFAAFLRFARIAAAFRLHGLLSARIATIGISLGFEIVISSTHFSSI